MKLVSNGPLHNVLGMPGMPAKPIKKLCGTPESLQTCTVAVSEVAPAPGPGKPAALFERIQALAGSEQGVRGVWVRQVTLENPLR